MGSENDLALKVLLQAQDQTGGVFKGFGSSLISFIANPGKLAAAGLIGIGAAAIGVGVAATKMAADYQQRMNLVQSLTGSSQQQMNQYDTGIKKLAIDAGVAPKQLASGLYNVLSASFRGADAMRVLTLATQDAKIGMTNATVTTDALTNILRSFSIQGSDATRVNGEMLETVTLGKATFEQYATTIVKAASSANQFHVSMETMNAAWSTMTSSGIRAAQASTDFQQSLKVMYGNINTVVGSLHKNKIAFDEAKFNAMDYGHKIQYMSQALEQANQKHVKVTGVTLQAAQAISAISKHIGDYNSNLATLSNKQAMAQKTAEAWKITQGGFNQTMDRLRATLDVVMISIGQKLLPVVTKFATELIPIVSRIGNWLVQSGALDKAAGALSIALGLIVGAISVLISAGSGFISFLQHGGIAATGVKIVLGLLAGAILGFVASGIPLLVAGFIAWATAAGAAAIATLVAAAPFILIGVIIAAVVIVIILAIKNWGAITTWLMGVWKAVQTFFGNLFSAIGSAVHTFVNGVVTWFMNLRTQVNSHVQSLISSITGFFTSLPGKAVQWGQNLIQGFITGIKNMVGSVGNAVGGVIGKVAGLIGFHSPTKEGPGASADQWSPNLMKMFIQGFKTNIPALREAVTQASAELAALAEHPLTSTKHRAPTHHKKATTTSRAHAHTAYGFTVPGDTSGSGTASADSSLSGSGLTINNYITIHAENSPAREVAKQVLTLISRDLRRSGNLVTSTSGGKGI